MLDDRDQRALDATAALLDRDDPELAACLRDHRLPPPQRRPVQRPQARRRVPRAVWPPLIMFLICLVLVVVPAVIVEVRTGAPAGASDAPTSEPGRREGA